MARPRNGGRPATGHARPGRTAMSRILIVYATGEGQTARITEALAAQLDALGHFVQLVRLTRSDAGPDPAEFDAVLVAASVHASRHQRRALRYVRQYHAALTQRPTAFLSVSLLAAATRPAGRQQALVQVETFLRQADWRPRLMETVAGAFRPAQLPWYLRFTTRLLATFWQRQLEAIGWPSDLTREQEFTDWDEVRRFGERFADLLPREEAPRPSAAAGA